jgi:hypothetical protein
MWLWGNWLEQTSQAQNSLCRSGTRQVERDQLSTRVECYAQRLPYASALSGLPSSAPPAIFDVPELKGLPMRYALSLLPVVLCAMLEAAQAAPATIEGSWSGSGLARYQGRVDRLVCRVNFAQVGQKSFRVSAFCSSGDRRYEQSGSVSSTGRDRYRGWVYNAQFNERGNVVVSQTGSRLSVTVSGERGTASLKLSRS